MTLTTKERMAIRETAEELAMSAELPADMPLLIMLSTKVLPLLDAIEAAEADSTRWKAQAGKLAFLIEHLECWCPDSYIEINLAYSECPKHGNKAKEFLADPDAVAALAQWKTMERVTEAAVDYCGRLGKIEEEAGLPDYLLALFMALDALRAIRPMSNKEDPK